MTAMITGLHPSQAGFGVVCRVGLGGMAADCVLACRLCADISFHSCFNLMSSPPSLFPFLASTTLRRGKQAIVNWLQPKKTMSTFALRIQARCSSALDVR